MCLWREFHTEPILFFKGGGSRAGFWGGAILLILLSFSCINFPKTFAVENTIHWGCCQTKILICVLGLSMHFWLFVTAPDCKIPMASAISIGIRSWQGGKQHICCQIH